MCAAFARGWSEGFDTLNVFISKKLRYVAAFLFAVLVLAGLGEARNKKGDKLYKQGQEAEAKNDYDAAVTDYDAAVATDPQDAGYLMADQRARNKAANYHVEQGRRLQQQQRLEEALSNFNKAFIDEPSSQIALQEIRATNEMIREKQRNPSVVVLTPAEQARQKLEKQINSLEGPPALKPINNEISSLKMNNQPARVLYESVGKLAGINVLFDPQGIETLGGPAHNFNLDLNNVTLEEALDYIALLTHTFWKPISHNAIFVTQEGEQKRAEYQDEVVKVFYVQNAFTANEFTEIYNALRVGSRLNQGLFQVQSQNAIVARGTPDTLALIEKMLHDLDRPKPEVVIDVIVMEVNKTVMSNIGAAILGRWVIGAGDFYSASDPAGNHQRYHDDHRNDDHDGNNDYHRDYHNHRNDNHNWNDNHNRNDDHHWNDNHNRDDDHHWHDLVNWNIRRSDSAKPAEKSVDLGLLHQLAEYDRTGVAE